jgi:hypothetical protein
VFIKIKYEESNDKKENNNVSTVDQSFNKQSENLLLNGIGLGLFIQSSVVLLLDFFAERRGEVYLAYLKTIIEN